MAYIEIEDMEFHAYHGCFKEERIVGNAFKVNVGLETDTSEAELSDNIADTINYQQVYTLVKEEMAKPSHLLEHVGNRILDALFSAFPSIEVAQIKIAKLNPPMGGKMKSVSVTLTRVAGK